MNRRPLILALFSNAIARPLVAVPSLQPHAEGARISLKLFAKGEIITLIFTC